MYPLDDTIAAISSPPGGAARGMVRLSGPQTPTVVQQLFQAHDGRPLSAPTRPTVIPGSLCLPGMASDLPCELYLWPDGRSYTGGAVAEIHTLGSRPLLEAVLGAVGTAGARMAEPGEFTLRAFLAGRIDLTQAEAVLGVIDAADPDELQVALAQLAGGLAGPLHALRDTLVDLLAHLEAGFDFADEDLPFITPDELHRQLVEAAESVGKLARQMASRGETAGTIRAVLVGWPNTGKSSLFNALVRDTGALVSEHPGTTRDYLTAELDLDGVKCQLIDTAGMAPEPDRPLDDVQRAAQAAAAEQTRRAHVQLLCIDSTRPLNDWEGSELGRVPVGQRIVVLTKVDAAGEAGLLVPGRRTGSVSVGWDEVPPTERAAAEDGGTSSHPTSPTASLPARLRTSSVTGEGIAALREELRLAVLTAGASGAEVVAGTAARCRESLRLAAGSLKRALKIARTGRGEELVAAEVRVALDELGKVVGAVYADDVLDRIFRRFCIGK